MKRFLTILLVVSLAFLGEIALPAAKAPKKPTIMVVPSDAWCKRNGFGSSFSNMGTTTFVPDYKKALQSNSDIRSLISAMGNFMAQNNFPIQDLEQKLKQLDNTDAEMSIITGSRTGGMLVETPIERLRRTANADIILDVDFSTSIMGPRKQVSFTITALDAYNSKIISGNVGTSSPVSSTASMEAMLNEAVLGFKDNMINGLIRYFDDAFTNGRLINIEFLRFDSCPINFDSEFNYHGQDASLADIIEVWFEDNCVDGNYGSFDAYPNRITVNEARMPLMGKSLSGKETALDPKKFVSSLVSQLKKSPYNLTISVTQLGLGKVVIYVGDTL